VRRHVDGVDTAPCLFWKDRNYVYELDPGLGTAKAAAATAAFHSWQAVADTCSDFTYSASDGGTKKRVIVSRDTTCTQAAPPNDPCIGDGTCPDLYNCWDGDSATLAVTRLTYTRSTGELLDAEVQLNASGWLFTTVDSPPCAASAPKPDCVATDVQNTLTHELGHAVGFDHTTYPGSTMQATAPIGETSKRTIDQGTAGGFCAVYPRGAPTPDCTSGM
jgi:hypothetical protein